MNSLAIRIHVTPIHASHVMRPSVWMLPRAKPQTAATATKIAVHAAWPETAFNPIEIPSIPAPATKIQTTSPSVLPTKLVRKELTKFKRNCEEFTTDTSE